MTPTTTQAKPPRRRRNLGGRPARRDHPRRCGIIFPGRLWTWLLMQSAREQRTRSAIVADALAAYRERGRP